MQKRLRCIDVPHSGRGSAQCDNFLCLNRVNFPLAPGEAARGHREGESCWRLQGPAAFDRGLAGARTQGPGNAAPVTLLRRFRSAGLGVSGAGRESRPLRAGVRPGNDL
jgi:hypothetical protein